MEKCEWCGKPTEEWNHVLQYSGRQMDEAFAINGLCKKCHELVTRFYTKDENLVKQIELMKTYFTLNAINRMTKEERVKYHKVSPPWVHQKEYLTKKLYALSCKN